MKLNALPFLIEISGTGITDVYFKDLDCNHHAVLISAHGKFNLFAHCIISLAKLGKG